MIQGEYQVSGDPDIVLTTILGSCVATCLCDPVAKVGGMNHFLLPGKAEPNGIRHGLLAMELLINGLLKMGARRHRIEAKLFGGAMMNKNLAKIGDANCAFAIQFLEDEGIRCLSQSLGGSKARRIRYVPTTGSAQQRLVDGHIEPDELNHVSRMPPATDDDVTLF